MGYAMPITVRMDDMTCPTCNISYCIPADYRARRVNDGKSWYCPNGHSLSYHQTEADRLRKMLADANLQNTNLTERARAAEVAATKAERERKRLLKRAHAGVCACCNRTFQNLAKHMATKHAEDGKVDSK